MPNITLCAADAQADAVPEPRAEDFKKAVSVLLPYLLSHRTRLASLEDSTSGVEDSASAARPGGAGGCGSCAIAVAHLSTRRRMGVTML